MPLSRRLALTEEQIEDIMTASWNCRIGTIGPGQRINITPMWFGWAGGKVYIYGRGQKVANLRRDSTCTVIVDRNERFPELQAIMMQGRRLCWRTRLQKRQTRICRKPGARWGSSTTADMVRRHRKTHHRIVRLQVAGAGAGSYSNPTVR